ncbi:hypothetical protein ACFO5R_21370 [Halosolutus amylolyticus]|uniref:Membrane domain of glycerophosphoryl diester phosphodiesterase n=1 Tax=Halosolutus amylolyticus TaxID=2932267 RepID=A0ABD5PV71_9EURY|nr:hypothetical protein [Halosolutus amylolyticus]
MDAVDDLSDAIDATRNRLTPFDAGTWLKLSIIVLFVVGFSAGGPTFPGGDAGSFAESPDTGPGPDPTVDDLPEDFFLYLAIAAGILLTLWLLFAFVSAVMEFAFIESLRSTEVHVRQYARRNVGRGARLFVFRALLSLLAAAIVLGPIAYVVLVRGPDALLAGWVIAIVLLAFLVYGLYAIVMRFTSEFVAPIMLLEDRGVLGGWRRFWGTFAANWTEYVVYLLLAWIILAVVQIAMGFLLLFGGLLLAIPFVVLFLLAFALGDVGVFLAIPIGIVAVVVYALFYGLIWMPVRSYFQYYALLLLGDTNAELDLIPDQRAAIRSDGGEPAGSAPDDEAHPDGRWGTDDRDESGAWDRDPDADDREDSTDDSWSDGTDDPWGDRNDSDPWDDESDDRDDDRGW